MERKLKTLSMERRLTAERLAKLAGKSLQVQAPPPQEPVTRKAAVRKPALSHPAIQTTH